MSPRQVIAALTRRGTTDGPDEIEQWVDGLRDVAQAPAALVDLATTAPIDTTAVLAERDGLTDTDDTRKEQA